VSDGSGPGTAGELGWPAPAPSRGTELGWPGDLPR
jgi:hypothetical protein